MEGRRTLVWFRGKDLRVADHVPLLEAARGEMVPLFVLDPYFFAPERARRLPHRMQFLLESIASLAANLERLGSRLVLTTGRSVDVVPELAARFRVDRVVAHRRTEPSGRERDRRIASALRVPFVLHEGETLAPPGPIATAVGAPFAVYTPFARAFAAQATIAEPRRAPRSLPPLPPDVEAVAPSDPLPSLESLGIARNPRILPGGEGAGRDRMRSFFAGPVARYHELRDRLDVDATSRLSVDLKFGTVSVRSVWNEAHRDGPPRAALEKYRSELLWREFTHHTLFHRPEVLREPFRREWIGFPWRDDEAGWRAWVAGTTGYPIVDAAARQLRTEGFVPNRARMIAASFLTKDLLVSYQRGEAHYMELLTDGDWAQNNFNWQWCAGCGCDAQPYFRVFNPAAQAERYDPEGAYVRRWVPELGTASYPRPIVDHAAARARFLETARAHLGRRSGRKRR
ncbi:MAG TPA: deoxyribodipyrimidine photo-lyase [Polyangiaceae bacterium]|nr:deoxyribodipyrimidine photo-lyase [Polyangiaceae bacterium]